VLGRYVGLTESKYQETGENRRVRSFTSSGLSSLGGRDGQGTWQAWVRREVDTGFWWENLQGRVPALRPRRRWEDDTKVGVIGRGWENLFCIKLAQDRDRWRNLVNTVTKFPVL